MMPQQRAMVWYLQHEILMKVAIAHWQGRIAPVFDVARNMLLVDVRGDVEQGRRHVVFEGQGLRSRVRQLVESGVDVLICGAISWPLEVAVRTARVNVLPQTCGEVETVLDAFLCGGLPDRAFLMPGCPCGRKAAHRRRRGAI